MDEVTLKMLEANGYSYNYGGIIDAEGNYVSSVELHGKTVNSESDITMFEQLKKVEENYLSHSDGVKKLKEYSEDPLTKTLPENAEEFYPSYVEEKIEKGEDTYETFEDFKKYEEEKGLFEDPENHINLLRQLQQNGFESIITEDHIENIKRNNEILKKYRDQGGDYADALEDAINNPSAKDNFLGNIVNGFWNGVYGIIHAVMPEGTGMDGTDEEIEEYKRAKEERRELKKPGATIVKELLDIKRKELESKWNEVSMIEGFKFDNDLLRFALESVEEEQANMQAFIDGDNVYNPFTNRFFFKTASLGAQGLFDSYVHIKPLHEKLINGEELTENEQLAADALASIDMAKYVDTEQTGLYTLTSGTLDSIDFLLGGAVGRVATRSLKTGATNYSANTLAKFGVGTNTSSLIGRAVGSGTALTAQAVLHPHTHTNAINKYYGEIYYDTDEDGNNIITTDRRTYKTLIDEVEIEEDRLNQQLSLAKDQDEITDIRHKLLKIDQYKNSIEKPTTAFDAAMYGFTEVMKENIAESYAGRVFNNTLTRKLKTKPWVKKVESSGIARALNKADKTFSGAKDYFNKMTGAKGSKLIGGNFEELWEEIAVQMTPVWGETDEEAIQRRGELFEKEFYGQVMGQTILMGGIMKGVQTPQKVAEYLKNRGKTKEARAAYKEMIKEFKNKDLDPVKIEELLMSSGAGNYTVQEYNNKIAQFHKEGNPEKAAELERDKYYNMGKSLIQMGKGKHFIRNMNAAIVGGKIPAESLVSVTEAIKEVEALQKDMSKHEGLPNRDYVLNLKSKVRYNDKQRKLIEEEISKLESQESSPEIDGQLAGLRDALKNSKISQAELNKEIESETSYKRLRELTYEAEVSSIALKDFKKSLNEFKKTPEYEASKKDGTLTEKIQQIKKNSLEFVQNEYGVLINDNVKKGAKKALEKAEFNIDKKVLKDLLLDGVTKIMKSSEGSKETPPEKLAAQKHVSDIEETIEGVYEVLEEIEETRKEVDKLVRETNSEKIPVNKKQNKSNKEALGFGQESNTETDVERGRQEELGSRESRQQKIDNLKLQLADFYKENENRATKRTKVLEKLEELENKINQLQKEHERKVEEYRPQEIESKEKASTEEINQRSREVAEENKKVDALIESRADKGVPTVDFMQDFTETQEKQLARIEAGIPTSVTVVRELSDYFYRKYKELSEMRKNPQARIELGLIEEDVLDLMTEYSMLLDHLKATEDAIATQSKMPIFTPQSIESMQEQVRQERERLTEQQIQERETRDDLLNKIAALEATTNESSQQTTTNNQTDIEAQRLGEQEAATDEITPQQEQQAPLKDPDTISEEDFFEEDLMPLMEGGKFKNPSMNRAVESLKKRVKEMEDTNGKKPTFEDYINDLIDNGDVDIENLKNHMRSLALIWAGAKLGKSNWVKLHTEMFENLARYELLDQQKDTSETKKVNTPETITKEEKAEEGNVNSKAGLSPVNFDPNTGAPIHVTPNTGKTYGTEHTIHYSAVEFEHEVKEVNGKKVYVKVKNSIPKMRKNRMFSPEHLVNPNKNNIGDKLSPKVLEGEDLANAPKAIRDKYGRQTGTVSFEQWVNDNIPEGMSFEEFQTTDLYISNVPMVYIDANGDAVAPVTEVDWFNSTSVGDRSKDVDEVDLDNLTPGHQADIAKNREQALELRKQILSGQVTEVEIMDNLSYAPLQKIDEVDTEGNPLPTKSLNEVSPDSQVVWMGAGGKIYGIDGQEIKLDDILNIGDAESGFLERETVYETIGGVKIPSKKPIKRNKTHYMVHTHTVDGVKKYRIFDTNRKNEQGEDSASNQDVETGRWIMAVNNITAFKDSKSGSAVLKDKNHPLHMSAEQAEDIRQQIKEITGIDVKTQYTGLLEAMIAEQRPDTVVKGEVVPGSKIVKGLEIGKSLLGYNKSTGEFATPNSSFVQNTLLSRKDFSLLDKPMITIKKNEDGSFTVEKVKITPKMVDGKEVNTAETYEDYLKERLSTNIMGYNVGTKEEPVFTTDVQQKVRFRPIVKEQGTPKTEIKEGIENNKKEEDVTKKVSEVNSKDIEEKNEVLKAERKAAIEDAAALAKLLNLDIRDIEEVDDMIVAEMTTTAQVESSINTVEGLTSKNEQDVVGWLFSKLSDRETSLEKVEKEFISEMDAKIESIENSLSKLEKFKDNPVTEALIKTLEDGKKQLESVKENIKPLMAEASLRAVNTSFITEEYEDGEDITEMNEKDYSRASNETKPIDKVGVALKRIFAQVKSDKTGFMGLDTYPSFKMMYDTVSLALSSDPALTPDFNNMMSLLEKRKETTPWMAPLIESLKRADEQTKNQFIYNTYKQKVYAKFATLSFDKNKSVTSNIYDSNANEAKRAVIDKWKENIKRSPINNEGTLNKETLKEIIQEWARWNEEGLDTQTNEVYQNWLSKFGIELSEGTWAAMRRGDLNISESGGRLKRSTFSNLFEGMTDDRSKARSGLLFSNLAKFAANSLQKDEKDLEFSENIKNHPFEDMSTILLQLAELESQHSPIYNSTSRYVNGKSVTEIESFTYFYEQFKKIKNSALSEDKQYINDLQELSFSQDSYILKLLQSDPVFASQFGHGMMDLMSLKELYKKSPMFASIEQLSSLDYMFVQRAIFQNRNQGSERLVPGTEFKVRMAHVNTLTNSDKGRMMLLKTGVFDFYKQSEEAFVIDEAGNITFTEGLNKLLYDNLIMPEMRRMVKFIKKGSETNIKDYDKGAVRFNILPGLNTLTNESGETIQEVIQSMEKSEEADILNKISEDFGVDISNYLQDNVMAEVNENVADLEQFNKKEIDGFNNVDYLAQRNGTVTENMKIAETDFILNSMLTNMNYMQMMAGDPALYYKGKGDPLSTDIKEQTKISQSLAINLGKRMAAMIAPGSVLAGSHENTYMQVFLEDVNGVADNIVDIIEMHYSKKELDSVHSDGVTYREMLQGVIKGDRTNINILTEKFNRVAEFIDIESTDAQEYTTLKEHLYVMEKQGRLSKKQLKKINAKIKAGKDLTKKELDLVLQPIKPVYTGTILDVEQDVNRMMYIKSSSFPLIPQLTKGRKLDDLRRNMEKVEEANPNTTVRASYQTANKVGALTSENTIKDFNQPIMPNNMLELKREHFKIQQDVPFKSDKVQDDTVSMGTQIFKLLMGDGIMEIDNFEFEGETLNGKQLQEKFHEVFSEMIGIKKDKFLKSLGLDDNMQSKNPKKAINKLQKLLVKEAKSRGFSKQDLKILELVDDGNGGKTFTLPLWLTANSNKYESMLNAMINNKIFKQKIPGNKFVAGSEAGFDIKETTEGMSDLEKSRVVHLGDFKGGVLQSTRTKEGVITKAQVLLPSKFKLGGELIDLFQDFDGENGLYLEKVDGIVKIKEGMIDKKLLDQFVFRIPTSSHGLGSAVEVVGFLPPESGDLIITPKGFVAQMGQDFDVDSLTAYQYNHLVMQDGSVKLLTEENKEAYIREQEQKLEALKEAVKNDDFDKITLLKESMPELENFEGLNKKGMLEEIQDIEKELSKNFDLKLLENKFIGIHNSVYSNPATQKHISKVLSMAYAEKQADEIESLTAGSGNSFNILSPKYQMNKMNAGSTGQNAIGIYAKGVTLHSLAQQAASTGKKIQLGSIDNEGVEKPKNITIGKLRSNGLLGNLLALPSNPLFESLRRRISTILDERTNTATDNEKAQILGRTGLNHTDAIAVDNLLTLLGFDSEHTEITEAEYNENKPFHRKIEIDGKTVYYKEHSIPYLLHSQPIIREYFNLINEKKSITTEFSGKAEESALEELLEKYSDKTVKGTPTFFNGKYGHLDEKSMFYSEQDNTLFTGEMLENQIVLGDKSRPLAQLQILATYIDLISQAKNVKEMTQHADLDNLGKSMWESTTKAKDFREFFTRGGQGILGVENLIGNFYHESEIEKINEERSKTTKTIRTVKKVKKKVKKVKSLEKYELFPGVFANKEQTAAIDAMTAFLKSNEKTFVLTGRGGTGKTTIVKKIAEANRDKRIMYIAPTHKAKAVLSKSVGDDAKTLASALSIKLNEATGKFEIDEYSRNMFGVPVERAEIIVIDESSMISDELLDQLMEDIGSQAKIIFMGDNAQLPPVGQDKDSKVFKYGGKTLTERMRQGEESPIVPLSDIVAENVEEDTPKRIVIKDRKSDFDKANNEGVLFIENEDKAFEQFSEDYKKDPESTKIITFNNQNHNSGQSVKSLNKKVRKKIFGEKASEYIVPGEQLMAYDTMLDGETPLIENAVDYTVVEIYGKETIKKTISKRTRKGTQSTDLEVSGYWVTLKNNITGEIVKDEEGNDRHFIPDEAGKAVIEKEISLLFRDKKTMPLGFQVMGSFINVNHGYAITSHKSQGSTYRNAYVMEDNILGSTNGGSNKAKNQSLYVGISRASHKLVMVSSDNTDTENIFKDGSRLSREEKLNQNKTNEEITEEEYEEIEVEEVTEEEVEIEAQKPILEKDLINLGKGVFLDPKTNQGVMVGTALSLSESLFTNLFPAKNEYVNKIIEDIFRDSNINLDNSFAVIAAKEQIFQEIKKYLTSAQGLGLFNMSAREVRRQLFTDDIKNGHVSLSSYINNAMTSKSTEYSKGLDRIKGNLFLNYLKTPMGENGKPSLITFNNQESFDTNQEDIFAAFKELIIEDISLPPIKRNGVTESYSTRKLAQELIAYSYASGGIVQGALEFHKFLPIEYLDDMTRTLKNGKVVSASQALRRFNTFNRISGTQNILDKFSRQYFQNNPSKTPQLELKEKKVGNSTVHILVEDSSAKYVSQKVKNPKSKLKQDNWRLFERQGDSGVFIEIDVLGETGMSEYQFGEESLTSNLGESKTPIRNLSELELEVIEHDSLGTIPASGSSVLSFLHAIQNGEYGDYAHMKEIAEYLMPFIKEGEVITYEDGPFKGRTSNGENLRLNPRNAKSREELAQTFMHETIHILTSKQINQSVDKEGNLLPGASAELIGLNQVFSEYKKRILEQDAKGHESFMKRWEQRKKEIADGIPITATFTEKEMSLYYPTVNLKEFIAMALGNNQEFLQFAGKMKYLETKGSILRKFGDYITRLVKRIGIAQNIEENSVALKAIENSFIYIESLYSKEVKEAKPVETDPQLSEADMEKAMAVMYGGQDTSVEPGQDVRDENSVDMLPKMKRTKNKCK